MILASEPFDLTAFMFERSPVNAIRHANV
jgi:hypothetical protein